MKNMKRILCSVLGVAMVFTMTTIGISAAQNFSDADQIVHVEAVNRAAELGYFVGSGGKFMPKDTVTRAQMATVIVKMLFTPDFNANPYKNMGRFPDTADYQGGWADGYINLCAKEGVVGGYGDGTFQPDNKVTAAEAVTMILNAFKVDAGKGSWPDTVMKKGAELGLFEELPGVEANTALNRDQLAALVMAGVDWEEEQFDGSSSGGSSSGSSSGGSSSGSSSGGGSGGSTVTPQDKTEPDMNEDELPGDREEPEQPEQPDAPAQGGLEEDELPGDREEPEQPEQPDAPAQGGLEEDELPGDREEPEQPEQPEQPDAPAQGGVDEDELPEDRS